MFFKTPNKGRAPSGVTTRERSVAVAAHNGSRGIAAQKHYEIEKALSDAVKEGKIKRKQAAGARAIGFAADLTKNAEGQRGFDLRGAKARFWSGFAGGAHEAAKDLTRRDGGLTLGQTGGGSVLHSAEYIKGRRRWWQRKVSEDRGEGGLKKLVGGKGAGYLWKRGSAEVAATAGEGSTISSPEGPRRQGNVFDTIENPIQESRNLTVREEPHQPRSPDTGTSAARRAEIFDANPNDLYKDDKGRDIISSRNPRSKTSSYGKMLDDQLKRKPLRETHAKMMFKPHAKMMLKSARSAIEKRRAESEDGSR